MAMFGNKSRFAIGADEECSQSDLLGVDVWAASTLLTCDDRTVYVPQFVNSVKSEIRRFLFGPEIVGRRPYPELSIEDNFRRLRNDSNDIDFFQYQFMGWGPTADNVRMALFCEGEMAYLPFEIWRRGRHDQSQLGRVFVAEVLLSELARVLHDAAWDIVWKWTRSGARPNEERG